MRPLPTAAVADACVRLKVPVRGAGFPSVLPDRTVSGRVLAVRHAGSVDIFFEALQMAQPGDVLVIDNEGRMDEGCMGDLTVLEALHHKVAAILVDGCHRDTAALRELGLPVWSRGHFPFGPRLARARRTDALGNATIGGSEVATGDLVALDDDGAVFVPAAQATRVWEFATRILDTEADQARRAKAGEPLCEQFRLQDYRAALAKETGLTFREHLRRIGKAIEE